VRPAQHGIYRVRGESLCRCCTRSSYQARVRAGNAARQRDSRAQRGDQRSQGSPLL